MKKYKTKVLKEYFKKIYHYRKYDIFDTEHSVVRYKERVSQNIDIYYELLEDAIDYIIKNKKEKTEDRYIFISKKHEFGIQLEWRSDRKGIDFAGFSATTFSKDEMNFVTKMDKKVFLENIVKQGNDSQESINHYYHNYIFEEELKKEMHLCIYDVFLEFGKIYKTFVVVEI